jgi:hypothetical protein
MNKDTVDAAGSVKADTQTRNVAPLNPVLDRATKLKPVKADKPAAEKPKAEPASEYEDITTVSIRNKKGKLYSLPVEMFSHSGSIIPFENARTVAAGGMDFVTLKKVGKSKAARKVAEENYKGLQRIHATMIVIAAVQGFKALDLKRLTVKRQVRVPSRRSVGISGTTDKKIPAFETFAQATAQANERRDAKIAKAAK